MGRSWIRLNNTRHRISSDMAEIHPCSVQLKRAAKALTEAKSLYVTAGAGMGVDSGLPDFRGPEGFWKAYPPLKALGVNFPSMSNPQWFDKDPDMAWGFFGHRYNLYTSKIPHDGFHILRRWGEQMQHGYFVFTSNVDGHFQRSGFKEDRIVECHGSIHYLQCVKDNEQIWSVPEDFNIEVDMNNLKATTPLPKGPPGYNNVLARPNILMFGDWRWLSERTEQQENRMEEFKKKTLDDKYVVVEIGAGLAVPTVRATSEYLVEDNDKGTLIRINPAEPEVPDGHVSLPKRGMEALQCIDKLISQMKR